MRLVVDDHNPVDMKRLSDFDRALNLLGELNDEFSNLAIIQLKKTSVGDIVVTASSIISLHGDRLGFEEKVTDLWNLYFGTSRASRSNVKFEYEGVCCLTDRQVGNGC